MRNTLSLVWKLLLICLIAGLVLGLVNQVTKDPIARLEEEAANESRKAAFPDAASFGEPLVGPTDVYGVYPALDANGNIIGYVGASKEHGYGGDVEVVIGMDMTKKIVGCVIGQNGDFSETAGLGAKVKDPAFAEQFIGLVYGGEVGYNAGGGGYVIPAGSITVKSIASEGTDPDAVSGATYSSTAVIKAFNNAAKLLADLIGGGAQ